MPSFHSGQLVTVSQKGESVDGIVFDTPGIPRVVVAVSDGEGGAEFRTVHFNTLKSRTHKGPDDDALRHLIHATPASSGRAAPGDGKRSLRGLSGHTGSRPHRTTGR